MNFGKTMITFQRTMNHLAFLMKIHSLSCSIEITFYIHFRQVEASLILSTRKVTYHSIQRGIYSKLILQK
jgi:hypothetical protein